MVIQITKRLPKLLGIVFLLSLMSSCDNSLDVTAEWKEIPVVYGLLNPYAKHNYIRINRAYLNDEGSALTYASNPDSIQFEDLTVVLVEKQDGQERNTINLVKVDGDTIGLPKEDGLFAKSPNILYRTSYDIKPSSFIDLYTYDLVIINNKNGNVYRSSTNVVGESEILSPIREADPRFNITDDSTRFLFIDYREAAQSRMYDCLIRFRYKEYPIGDPDNYRIDSVDWTVFKNQFTIKLFGYEEQIVSRKQYVFYDYLSSAIPHDPTVEREPIDMGFYLLGGGEDLYTYIQVNKPSIGIVQKKPEFTNIENGLGIFSSLSIKAHPHVVIDNQMRVRLALSDRVSGLNFVTP